MCKIDRVRHIAVGLVGSITEHHSLISCSDRLELLFCHLVFSGFKRSVNTHGDVSRLLIKSYKDCACVIVKFHRRIRVADFADRVSRDLFVINFRFCCDLSADQYKSCAGSCLTRHSAHGILLHACVKDRVRDHIAYFVGMPFCD